MRRLYTLVIILAVSIAASAQTNIKITQDKIKRDGVVLYVHNVQKSETLYSIAKAYNVSIKEIVENNQALNNGLKEGMILYIPDKLSYSPTNSAEEENDKDKQPVRKRKRLWRQDRIANALRKSGTVTESTTEEETADNAVTSADSTTVKDAESVVADEHNMVSPNRLISTITAHSNARLAIVLPFNSKDTLGLSSNFMDFYAGSLLALDSLSALGIDVTLDVIDQSDYSSVEAIGRSGRLNTSNIVIGPVKKAELTAISPYIGEHTLLVSPMDQNASELVAENNRFVQMPTDFAYQLESLVESITKERNKRESNVVIIYESGNADSLCITGITKGLDERYIRYSLLHYNILEGRSVEGRIKELLRENVNNIVIVPSNNEAFVSDAVRNLSLLNTAEMPVMLFGMPKWKNFEVVDIYQLHQLNLHLSLPYYVDYDNPATIHFVERYKALYNTYPTPYAFQGYDIVFYMAYARYGGAYNALQSNFVLRSSYGNLYGYYNTGTKNIIYNKDFTISVED